MSIGENIKYFRVLRGLTQEELANKLNISHQSISKWEKEIALPSISYVIPLITILDISLVDLFKTMKKSKE